MENDTALKTQQSTKYYYKEQNKLLMEKLLLMFRVQMHYSQLYEI